MTTILTHRAGIDCEKRIYIDTCVSGHNVILGKEIVDRILNIIY